MKQSDIRVINAHQQQYYERIEKDSVDELLKLFSDVMEKMKNRSTLRILDIGGASGNFALALYEFFNNHCEVEVFVLDTTKYDTWVKFTDKITFVVGSADNLDKLFEVNTFDLVFVNRTIHHFVRNSWKTSIDGIAIIMTQIRSILKRNGNLCIVDFSFNGLLYDKASSKIIYALTSCKLPIITTVCKKLGGESAGIGVCFLSKQMWLNLFSQTGFIIEAFKEGKRNYDIASPWYRRLCLFIKTVYENNVFILEPV
ncbi:hypothetical protein EZS27_015845 [termite gut metagenome]|uniref:Methyltransferase domain-containing protein n=1 Tax=termite gut metagenome TaxID=433724 RepID=A0A5J4RSN0_9ZZZZ